MGDATKARETLGWGPRVSFEELVKIMYETDLAEREPGRKPALTSTAGERRRRSSA